MHARDGSFRVRQDEEPAGGEGRAGALGDKVTMKRATGSDTPSSGTKRKLSKDATNMKQGTPLNHASSSSAVAPAFST